MENGILLYPNFKGKNILIGISGGIAAYKIPLLIRNLVKSNANVYCVTTKNAYHFITKDTLFELSKNPVIDEIFFETEKFNESFAHIDLKNKIDVFLIAPATLNIIGKIASGIADDILTTVAQTFLGAKKEIIISPSMNQAMYNNPILKENLKTLKNVGVTIVDPDIGTLACDEYGEGRMPEINALLDHLYAKICPQHLKGKKVLITSGPTREYIDDIRFISNTSTGRRGYTIAKYAAFMGAQVTLISGNTKIHDTTLIDKFIFTPTSEIMYKAVMDNINEKDIFISVAGVTDFGPSEKLSGKIKKENKLGTIELKNTMDILKEVSDLKEKGKLPKNLKLCGFSLETEKLKENAKKKLKEKRLDLICANSPDKYERVILITKNKEKEIVGDNETIAQEILNLLI